MSLENISLDQLVFGLQNYRLGLTECIMHSPFNLTDDVYHCSAIVRERKRQCF